MPHPIYIFINRRVLNPSHPWDERYPCGPQLMPWELGLVTSLENEEDEPVHFLPVGETQTHPIALAFKPIMDEGV